MGLNLVTRAEYKAYTGISGTAQDTAIDILIPRISELVKSFCRRTFIDYVNDPKTETFNGSVDSHYYLREYPVISVVGVEASTDYGQNYTELTEFTDYVHDIQNDSIVSLHSTSTWPTAINGYKVTYFAGFDPLPEDIKLAVFDLISYYLKNEAVTHLVRSPSSSIMQLEYITTATFPVHIARVLNLYKASWD